MAAFNCPTLTSAASTWLVSTSITSLQMMFDAIAGAGAATSGVADAAFSTSAR
ncbi:hypothetical protein [Janthinobacterium lividum]|uniref:hypothetical protein n=1 Tax=Janthinobacterium lividum TaxID=29581 RepID=UPI003CC836F9